MPENKISAKVAIGIYAMYFLISGAGATTAGLAAIGVAFPDVDPAMITLINTLPSLSIIVGTIGIGAVAGKLISFKNAAIISLIIYLIFGIMPVFFCSSFTAVLVQRVIWGLASGMISPLGAGAITNLIENKDERSKLLGRGGAMQQIGCVVLTLLGGFLVNLGWNYTFAAYGLALLALIVVIVCYKDDPSMLPSAYKEKAKDDKPKEKMHIGGVAIAVIVIMALAQMFCSPTMMNFSNLIAENVYSNLPAEEAATAAASPAGVLLSIFVLAGAVGSLLLGKFTKALKGFTGLAMFIICAVGMLIVSMSSSIAGFTIGILVFGFGWCAAIPFGNLDCANVTNKAGLAFVASLLWGIMNVGNFFSSYWLQAIYSIFGVDYAKPILIGAVLFVVLGIVWAVVNLGNKAWKKGGAAVSDEE